MRSARTKAAALAAPRGFALIIVSIAGVAITAIALALVFTAGSSKILSAKGGSTDRATNIAASGLERGMAYLLEVARQEGDYDRVLEDALACSGARARGLPRYSDGTVDNSTGTDYLRVDFSDGSYFTRVDDDADDAVNPLTDLSAFTSNHANSGSCLEGPLAFGGTVANPGNNPHRDRNRTVWLTVIGAYPAGPLNTAIQRIVERRLFMSPEATPTAAVSVGGNVILNGTLSFCSNQGFVAGGGNINGGGTLEHCGNVTTAGGIGSGITLADPSCGAVACTPRGTASVGTGVARPLTAQLPPVADPAWYDASSPCNFLMVDSTLPPSPAGLMDGLYYWDGTGTRSGVACSSRAPALTPPTPPAAGSNIDITLQAAGTCWVPLMLLEGGVSTAGVTAELGAGAWQPGTGTAAWATVATTAGGVHKWSGVSFAAPPNKPDWSACTVTWRPPDGSGDVGCTSCNGGTSALQFTSGAWSFGPATAVPAGMYIHAGSMTLGANSGATPTNDATPGQWPLATLAVQGNLNVQGAAFVGVGTSAPLAPTARNPTRGLVRWPSVMVGGSLTTNANLTVGGSLYVRGNIATSGNTVVVYGQAVAGGNVNIGPGDTFAVRHDDAFATGTQERILALPTASKTVR